MTIRRRGSNILKRPENLPAGAWHDAVIDIPKRRHQKIRYVDELIKLSGYEGQIRQVAVTSNAVEIAPGNRLIVYLDRRSHNPILREANLAPRSPKNSLAGEP